MKEMDSYLKFKYRVINSVVFVEPPVCWALTVMVRVHTGATGKRGRQVWVGHAYKIERILDQECGEVLQAKKA